MQKHYTVYKVTNTVNNKFYIGQHQTVDLYDNYLGSGTAIKHAIKKYGCDQFVKEVLHVFDNFDEMNLMEETLVTKELIRDPTCYNQVIGGQGDNVRSLQQYVRIPEHCRALSESKKGFKCDPNDVAKRAKSWSAKIAKMSKDERKAKFGHYGEDNGFFNKTHTEETKQKVRDTIGNSRKGGNNANAKPVKIYGKSYSTKKECYTTLGISKRKLNQILEDLEMKNNKRGER